VQIGPWGALGTTTAIRERKRREKRGVWLSFSLLLIFLFGINTICSPELRTCCL